MKLTNNNLELNIANPWLRLLSIIYLLICFCIIFLLSMIGIYASIFFFNINFFVIFLSLIVGGIGGISSSNGIQTKNKILYAKLFGLLPLLASVIFGPFLMAFLKAPMGF